MLRQLRHTTSTTSYPRSSPSESSSGSSSELNTPIYSPHSRSSRCPSKGKGVPRSKEGCLTCRIRRKKCKGGKPVCEDCRRLDIHCYGYTEKRPKWMKDSIQELRRKITEDLLERGKIKGRRKGTLQSEYEHEPKLEPQEIDLSARALTEYGTQEEPIDLEHIPTFAPDSPPAGNLHLMEDYSGTSGTGLYMDALVPMMPTARARTLLGHRLADSWDLPQEEPSQVLHAYSGDATRAEWPVPPTLDVHYDMDSVQRGWITYYVKNVLPMQYLIPGGRKLQDIMVQLAFRSITGPPDSMACLGAVHHYQLNPSYEPEDRNRFYQSSVDALSRAPSSASDAMTALHLISVSLFNGCNSDWLYPLNYARMWFEQALPSMGGAALLHSDALTKFVCKTTMWMDIFGAISSQTSPKFMNWYRVLFQLPHAGLVRENNGYNSVDAVKMDATMGCDNEVMLAFAEIAELDAWKGEHQDSFSYIELVDRANKILGHLTLRRSPVAPPASLFSPTGTHTASYAHPSSSLRHTAYPYSSASIQDEEEAENIEVRRRMSAVFRESAIVYLHTVISGCRPQVPEIKAAVSETIKRVKVLASTEEKPYDRSLVLPLFIAGVMTDNAEQQTFIYSRLTSIKNVNVGNCRQVRELMQRVWQKRKEANGAEVCWRQTMKDMNMSLLFV